MGNIILIAMKLIALIQALRVGMSNKFTFTLIIFKVLLAAAKSVIL